MQDPIRARAFNPLHAVGLLFKPHQSGTLGSCFAFRKTPYLLTDAHCLMGLAPKDLGMLLPRCKHCVPIRT